MQAVEPAGIAPRLSIHETLDHYTVDASSAAELRTQLRVDDDPTTHAHALTEGRFVIMRSLVQREDRCEVEDITIRLEIATTLPAWAPGAEPPATLRAHWESLLALMQAHEDRHRANLLEAAFGMRDRIAQMPVQARCAQVEAALKAIVDGEERKRRFADDMIDQRWAPGPPRG